MSYLLPVIDILVVAVVIYAVLLFVRQTKSFFIFGAMGLLFGINYLAKALNLELTRQLFQPLLTFFLVIFVVVFQREIRRFFDWLVRPGHRKLWQRPVSSPDSSVPQIIAATVRDLVARKIGALIVLAGGEPWELVVRGGFALEGKLSAPLLLSIFDPSSPGHDGAVMVEDGLVKSFGVHLPLAENFKHFSHLGTRHRAGLGMSERTDALVIIVSEERGAVSLASRGVLTLIKDPAELGGRITTHLHLDEAPTVSPRTYFISHNWGLKVTAVLMAVLLWWMVVRG